MMNEDSKYNCYFRFNLLFLSYIQNGNIMSVHFSRIIMSVVAMTSILWHFRSFFIYHLFLLINIFPFLTHMK